MKNRKYYLIFIASMILFGAIGILRKNIIYSSSLIAFVRAFVGSIFLLIILLIKRINPFKNIGKKNLIMLMVGGASLTLNWVFLFEAFKRTTVSQTTLILYLEPTFVFLYFLIFEKEEANVKKIVCISLSLIGMVFMSGIIGSGDIKTVDFVGLLFALIASILYSTLAVVNRKIEGIDNYQKTFLELLFGFIILIPYVLINHDFKGLEFDLKSVILLIISSVILTGFVYILYFSSIGKIPSVSFSILSYIDPITALILSITILKEKVTVFLIIGAILIIMSQIILEVNFKKTCEK